MIFHLFCYKYLYIFKTKKKKTIVTKYIFSNSMFVLSIKIVISRNAFRRDTNNVTELTTEVFYL